MPRTILPSLVPFIYAIAGIFPITVVAPAIRVLAACGVIGPTLSTADGIRPGIALGALAGRCFCLEPEARNSIISATSMGYGCDPQYPACVW